VPIDLTFSSAVPVLMVAGSPAAFTGRVTSGDGTLDVIGPFCPTTVNLSPTNTISCAADPTVILVGTSSVSGPLPTGPTARDRMTVTLRTADTLPGRYTLTNGVSWRRADRADELEQNAMVVLTFEVSAAT
jgi:hypothetical protein